MQALSRFISGDQDSLCGQERACIPHCLARDRQGPQRGLPCVCASFHSILNSGVCCGQAELAAIRAAEEEARRAEDERIRLEAEEKARMEAERQAQIERQRIIDEQV